jgi:cell division protein FtsB
LARSAALRFLLSPKALALAVIAWALFEGLLSQHSLIKLREFRHRRDDLQQQVAQAENQRAEYKKSLERLENDPYFVEKLARERLGLVKEGEIVYRFEEPPPQSSDQGPVRTPIVDEKEPAEP